MKKFINYFSIYGAMIFLFALSTDVFANAQKFEKWKTHFIKKAQKTGLKKSFLRKHLEHIKYDPSIVEIDRKQSVFNEVTYQDWIKDWLRTDEKGNQDRIIQGKALLKKHLGLLKKIEKKYQIDKEIIVSLWGVETYYGQITGHRDILASLSTLAFDKRRRKFFEKELLAALKILAGGHIDSENFKGSWAGALGQCQFMPSNFFVYAQDFDKDGKKDIWNNLEDIFASIAYFLKKSGWKKGHKIGDFLVQTNNKAFSLQQKRYPASWNKLGMRKLNGQKLKGKNKIKLSEIPLKSSPYILQQKNYRALMRWNHSSLFAALNMILFKEFKLDY